MKRIMRTAIGVRILVIMTLLTVAVTPLAAETKRALTPEEAKEIAHEAYLYGISAVDNYRVYLRAIADPTHPVQMTPNKFNHLRELVGPELGDTPNNDALFSYAIIDLRREPIVISVPEVEDDRLYMLQLGDTSTETLPYISSIATGTKAGNYALVGPDFAGYLPAERFDGIITTLGQLVAVTGRTAVDGADDVPTVIKIQESMKLTPLSTFLGTEAPAGPGPLKAIPWDAKKAKGISILNYINMAMAWQMPTLAEVPILERFARIGVIPGKQFTAEAMSPAIIAAVEDGLEEAKTQVTEMASTSLHPNVGGGWQYGTSDIARFGTNYLLRAMVSSETIYPNTPDHAMYGAARTDSGGQTLTGKNVYEIVFAKGALPPVDGFWSLTMYDSETTAMVPNALDRYSIGDRTEGLVYGQDGSLKIVLQREKPQDKSLNWLPAPEGAFYLILRLYAPSEKASSGEWVPPAVIRLD